MTAEDGLPPLREAIARHGLAAKKSLGQNFLFDLNLTRKIARAALPFEDFTIVEVGPGPGGLTRALLIEGAKEVVVVERDPRAIPALNEIAAHYPGRLRIIEEDALNVVWREVVHKPAKIVANLPYNVGCGVVATVVFIAHADVPEGSGFEDHRCSGYGTLRTALGALQLALRDADVIRHKSLRLHAAA
jgi:16S rRNA (adenine1518-N6/adenine1519-N6)-dimethyltransferase